MSNNPFVMPLSDLQRSRAMRSFATRRVPMEAMKTLVGGSVRPRTGDVVLAQVTRIGNHRHLERDTGRRSVLHVDDLLVLAYADRYATDQYESYVPTSLRSTHLVASGGIASHAVTRSNRVKNPTDIQPLGLIGDAAGRPLNLEDFALPRIPVPAELPPTIAVLGTAMNSGKTTTIHYLVHGLAKAGARPGTTKVTGTGAGNDYWVMLDAGGHRMLDFTDAGLSSTFRHSIPRLEDATEQLVSHLAADGSGVIFVEIADGVFQEQNRHLIRSARLHRLIDKVVFAASDAMGAALGVQTLTDAGFDVVAVSGSLTRSPLAVRESEQALGLPVLGIPELQDPEIIMPLLGIDEAEVTLTPQVEEPLPWDLEIVGLEPEPATHVSLAAPVTTRRGADLLTAVS